MRKRFPRFKRTKRDRFQKNTEANDSAENQATEPESEPETDTTPEPPSKKTMTAVSANLDVNHEYLQKLFAKSSDLVIREVLLFHGTPAILVFLDGLVNLNHLDEVVLKPLMQGVGRDGMQLSPPPPQDADELLRKFLAVGQARHVHNMNDAIDACMSGDTMFLLDGFPMSVIVSSKQWEHRMPSEPDTESVVRGPREGFVENIRTNTALLRRRIRTPHFQMESLRIGRVSKTDVVMSYIEGITKDSLVEEIRSRLKRIDIDGVLDSGYIEEFLEDQPWSPFPTIQPTERPDTTAAALLEGRVAILVDGSPFVLIAPSNLWGNLQSNEDYFERFMFTTLIRWLRYIFTIIALTLPSLYIAITTFHQEMMPTNLLLSIAAARESSPFPALVEAFAMEITFEALREAGVRLPKTVGQAVSIVGALVIGQAAVQAGIVSAPMVIVVSLTGIANFTIPRYTFALSVRMLRFPLMILAGTFGLYGIVIGLIAIIVHVCSLRSFGVPYTTPVAPLKLSGLKDLLARVPWWAMNKRPSPANEIRVPYGQKPHPPQDDMETEQK